MMELSAPLRKHAQGVTEEGPRKIFSVRPKNFSGRPVKRKEAPATLWAPVKGTIGTKVINMKLYEGHSLQKLLSNFFWFISLNFPNAPMGGFVMK